MSCFVTCLGPTNNGILQVNPTHMPGQAMGMQATLRPQWQPQMQQPLNGGFQMASMATAGH